MLKRLDGRRILDNAQERLTDHEAVQIALYRDAAMAARVKSRFERYGGASLQEMQRSQMESNRAQGFIDPYIEQRASEAYLALRSRMTSRWACWSAASRAWRSSRERKSVLLISEGFAYDHTLEARKRAVEAARRANVALYFIDTRGLDHPRRRSTARSSARRSPRRT